MIFMAKKAAHTRNVEHLMLNEWIYGLNMLAHMRNPRLFRETALLSSRHWAKNMGLKGKGRDDLKAAQKYVKLLESAGLEEKGGIRLKKVGKGIRMEVKAPCLYKQACLWMLDKKVKPQCARGMTVATGPGAFPAHKYELRLKSCAPKTKCVADFVRKT